MSAIILNSGGFDSVLLMHMYGEQVKEKGRFQSLFFDYGQRCVEQERERAEHWAIQLNALKVWDIKTAIPWSKAAMFNPAITSATEQTDYVEARNLIFLSYAISLAEAQKCDEVVFGAIIGDYNDCSKKFVSKMNDIAHYLTDGKVKVVAPLMPFKSKDDEVVWAFNNFNLHPYDCWSCSLGSEGNRCGNCPSCLTYDEIIREKGIYEDR